MTTATIPTVQTIDDALALLPTTVRLEAQVASKALLGALKSVGARGTFKVAIEPGLRVSAAHLTLPDTCRIRDLRKLTEDLAFRLDLASVRVRTGVHQQKVTLELAHTLDTVPAVSLGDVIPKTGTTHALPWAIGVAANGCPLVVDLADAPHVLIGGQTGSGKSSHLHSLICSLALLTSPEDVELLFIDPKQVDLSPFVALPHVQLEPAKTTAEAHILVKHLLGEAQFRFEEFARAGVAEIADYNAWASLQEDEEPLRRVVVVADELAMLLSGPEGEALAADLTQLSQICRAAGIHLVLATQRPSATAVPSQLRAQLTSRVACRVATATDSRLILDAPGAERLLGAGDTLIRWGGGEPERVQGTYVSGPWRRWVTDVVAFLVDPPEDEAAQPESIPAQEPPVAAAVPAPTPRVSSWRRWWP